MKVEHGSKKMQDQHDIIDNGLLIIIKDIEEVDVLHSELTETSTSRGKRGSMSSTVVNDIVLSRLCLLICQL